MFTKVNKLLWLTLYSIILSGYAPSSNIPSSVSGQPYTIFFLFDVSFKRDLLGDSCICICSENLVNDAYIYIYIYISVCTVYSVDDLPLSQLTPVKPGIHRHRYLFSLFSQSPLTQGFDSHSSKSVRGL